MQVFIYARWSSLEQTKGSTLDRQIKNCTAFVEGRGWTVAETIIDRGRSAYTGDNIKTGNLGAFADRVKIGAVKNAWLIVEELDRLSRQAADEMLQWMSPLIRAGLTIAVTQTGQIIDLNMLDNDIGGLLMLLITSFGSNKESKKKAERVGAAWEKKRNDATEGRDVIRKHRHPMWLRVREGDGQFEPVPGRDLIVKRIFADRLRGLGKLAIAKALNADGVPVWSATKKPAKMGTYVGRILVNRAVVGEWQPFNHERGQERKPAGEPITAYYPVMIDAETFARANDKRAENQRKHQGRGRSLSNLLGTRARCGDCGGQMIGLGSARYKLNKDGTTTCHYFLYCQNAKVAKTCGNQRGWTYDKVENPILDRLLTLAMDDQHFAVHDECAPIEAEVYTLREEVAGIQKRVDRLLDMLEADDADMEARYRLRRVELNSAKERLVDAETRLAEARGKTSPDEHLKRVAEVRSLMTSPDEETRFQARSRVKEALQDLIGSIQFDASTGTVWVELIRGIGTLMIQMGERYSRGTTKQPLFYERADTQRGNTDAAFRNATPEEKVTIKAYLARRPAPAV
jgi:DNA invertase Pin-like site-specific DNA recombinase